MLADPVSGFLAGFTSTFGRVFIGSIAIFFAFVLCFVCGTGLDPEVFPAWAFNIVFMIFTWATYGGWFIIGLAAFITIFFCLWLFVNESQGKRTFFVMFTAAVIYFFPLDIFAQHWISVAVAYVIIAFCYWIIPRAIAAILPEPAEEIGVATSIPESEPAPTEPDVPPVDEHTPP